MEAVTRLLILHVPTVLMSINGLFGERCNWNQISVVNSKLNTTCVNCPSCEPGFGLSPQCGSVVSKEVTIKCVRCITGRSYSDETSLTSCRPCTQCGPNEQTLRKCSPTKNAICGKCNQGYYREFTGDCHPCRWCCAGAATDELSAACLKQGIPKERACRDISSKNCGPSATHSTNTPTVTRTTIIYVVPTWMAVLTGCTLVCLVSILVLLLLSFKARRQKTLRRKGILDESREDIEPTEI